MNKCEVVMMSMDSTCVVNVFLGWCCVKAAYTC